MRFIVILLLYTGLNAAAQPIETTIKQQAMQMGTALCKGDRQSFSKFIPSELLKNPEDGKMILQMIDSGFSMFKSFGGEIKNISFGHPTPVIKDEKKWQSTLLQTTTIVSPFADAELQSVLLAQSIDKGRNWTFIDLSFKKVNGLKEKMPPLHINLQIPKALPPKITLKQEH